MIFKNVDRPGWKPDIDSYLGDGGYEELKKALTMSQPDIVNEVKASGLRGRGGAGFPCGVKWGFIKQDSPKPIYLICNADESEPGTFKDRYIIHQDPHQLIEGMIISCYAVNAKLAYLYIRGEFPEGARILERALAEARERGFLGKNIQGSGFDCEIYVHRGAGAYICGEETGLIESLEGKRPYPRIKPPYFPAVLGLYQCPTIVNNVETLCHVKHIIRMGGAEYAKIGRPNNTGTRILCVSGDVQKPGYFEVEVGSLTMGELINDLCGGMKQGRKLKAVIPAAVRPRCCAPTRNSRSRKRTPTARWWTRKSPSTKSRWISTRWRPSGPWPGRAGSSSWTTRATWSRRWRTSTSSTRTRAAANARPAARDRCGCRRSPGAWCPARARNRTRRCSRTWPTTSPARRSARSARRARGRRRVSWANSREEFEAKAQKNVTPREVSDGVALANGRPCSSMDTRSHTRRRAARGNPKQGPCWPAAIRSDEQHERR